MLGHYLVSIVPRADVKTETIETVLNLTKDWYRFRKNTWVVVTKKTADDLYELLRDFAKPSGQLFICKLEISDRRGWMSKAFWTWLKKKY